MLGASTKGRGLSDNAGLWKYVSRFRRIEKILCLPSRSSLLSLYRARGTEICDQRLSTCTFDICKANRRIGGLPWGANQTPIYPLFASTATCRDANTSIAHQILLSPSSPRPTSQSCPCRSGHCGPQAYQTPARDRHSSPIFMPSDQSAFLSKTHPRIRSQPSCGRCHSSLRDLHEVFPPKSVPLASVH
jgi:hypothetical protein